MIYDKKLIVLRGNSGSGKSTVAKKLREVRMREAGDGKIAYIEQDAIRRAILKEKEVDNGNNIELIQQIITFALARDYDVVLEGILYVPRYSQMLKRLIDICPNHYVYYFDVSFEETLRRHVTKQNAHEFGEKEMRQWYRHRNLTNITGEKIIPEESTLEQTVSLICHDVYGF